MTASVVALRIASVQLLVTVPTTARVSVHVRVVPKLRKVPVAAPAGVVPEFTVSRTSKPDIPILGMSQSPTSLTVLFMVVSRTSPPLVSSNWHAAALPTIEEVGVYPDASVIVGPPPPRPAC